MTENKGIFITFEGMEGSGKSTQCKLLNQYFFEKNTETVLTTEPGGTDFGREIRKIVLDNISQGITPETELLLYIADRTHHVKTKIQPALEEGKVVICDRYHDSALAYQHYARGVDKEIMDFLFEKVAGNLIPDITFLINISLETSFERVGKRAETDSGSVTRFEMENRSFHEKVRNGFLSLAEKESRRFVIIDGNQTVEKVFDDIKKSLNTRMENM